MRKLTLLWCAVFSLAFLANPLVVSAVSPGISSDEAAIILKEGNGRYTDGKLRHLHQDRERRALTAAQGEHPLAAVLTCSDSRVPPEIIFDQGIGDLFIIRVAGNVAATTQIGSIEYAVDYLATPLIIVLGHTECDAVTAVADGTKLPPNIAALVEPIGPAVDRAREDNPEAAKDVLLKAASKDNVWQSIAEILQNSPIIRDKIGTGRIKLIGAFYEVDSGKVEWLGPHPEQDKLLGAKKAPGGRKGRKDRRSEE